MYIYNVRVHVHAHDCTCMYVVQNTGLFARQNNWHTNNLQPLLFVNQLLLAIHVHALVRMQ